MSEKANSQIIKLIYILIAGIIVTQAFRRYSYTSLAFYLVMLLSICLWFNRAVIGLDRNNLLAIIIVAISTVNVLLNVVINGGTLEMSDMTKLFSFLLAVLFLAVSSNYRPDQSTIEFVFNLNSCIVIFWLLMYVVKRTEMYIFNGRVSRYLTFGFTNPNLLALFLQCCTTVELIRIVRERRWSSKCFHFLLAVVALKFLVETGSRNSLLSMSIFGIVWLVAILFPKSSLNMPKWLAGAISIFPLAFSIVYMLAINSSFIDRFFDFLVDSGKELDSRVAIWKYAWSTFTKSPVIGAFTQVLHGTRQSHMHNSHVDILASYGIVVFILFCVFLYQILTTVRDNASNRVNRLSLWAFATILLTGVGESAIFSGGLGIYCYVGVFLLIANQSIRNET